MKMASLAESPMHTHSTLPRPPPPGARTHSRIDSRSSETSNAAASLVDVDPLLRNLSPEAILNALYETPTLDGSQSDSQDLLSQSISELSSLDRALGIRAAVAALRLRQWLSEVTAWKWPSSREAALGRGFENPCLDSETGGKGNEASLYLGCLPKTVVDEHEMRISQIKDGLDHLSFAEIERHILDAHLSSSPYDMDVDPDHPHTYKKLNDFTAVITATVMKALPILAKLNILLNTWNVRLNVLRQVPLLLRSLDEAQLEMRLALSRLEEGLLPGLDDPWFTRQMFDLARGKLENKILYVGQQLDNLLDALEGSEDCLPSYWIDDMEALESHFAYWSVEAEKKAIENDWRRDKPLERLPSPIPEENDESSTIDDREVIAHANMKPPETRQYWTGSEDDSGFDGGSSITTSPLSKRDSLPNISIQDPEGKGGRVAVKQEEDMEAKPQAGKHNDHSAPATQLHDPFISFATEPSSNISHHDESVSPKHPIPKRRMTLPLSRFMDEESFDSQHPSGANGPDIMTADKESSQGSFSPEPEVTVHNKPTPANLGSKAGSRSLRDAFIAAQTADPNGPNHHPATAPAANEILNDPFVESSNERRHFRRSSSPPGLGATLEIHKKRTKQPASSESLSDDNAETEPFPSVDAQVLQATSEEIAAQREGKSPAPVKRHRRRRTLEDQISSILDTIPAQIKLDANGNRQPPRAPSDGALNSSRSQSRAPSRAGQTAPLFTLVPAPTKRTKSDESSAKLFYLHRGEKAPPAKLLLRTVGDGERVMVRIGGGWADFGEYLREYVAHHGQRTISEKWEVQSVPQNNSNGTSPPRKSPHMRYASTPTKSGRTTPISRSRSHSRPGSPSNDDIPPLPQFPRDLNQKDRPSLTAANVAKASGSPAPSTPIFPSLGRRMSISSMHSGTLSVSSIFGDSFYNPGSTFFLGGHPGSRPGSSLGFRPASPFNQTNTTVNHAPLGLAGPRPRRVSITPENEQWVEDMMGKARKASSGNRPHILENLQYPNEERGNPQGQFGLHSMRSFNDIDKFNRRVFLRRFNQ